MVISNEEITVKGLKIEFWQSEGDSCDWDNVTKMVCFHGRYNLGDDHDYKKNDYSSWEELKEDILQREDVLAIKPLYLYDHSGLSISTTEYSCSWDSGQVGWVYITKELVDKVGLSEDSDLDRIIESEVEIYNMELRGDVYGFTTYKDGKMVNSIGGFYGSKIEENGMLEHLSEEYISLIKDLEITEIEL